MKYQQVSAITAAATPVPSSASIAVRVAGEIRAGDDQRRIGRDRQAGLLDQHVEEDEPEPELQDQVDEMVHAGAGCGADSGRQFTHWAGKL